MEPTLNEVTKKFIEGLANQKQGKSLNDMNIFEFRDFQAELNSNLSGKANPDIVTMDDKLELEGRSISLRIHTPNDYVHNMPTLLYVAGGAFVTSGLENIAPTRMAKNCRVIVIGHRLAPEYKISECVDDVASGIEQIITNSKQFSIEGPVIVGGDSSGASFALTAMVKLRDKKSDTFKSIKGMIFISPAVDLSMQPNKMKKYDDKDALFFLDAVKAVQAWLSKEDLNDPVVSPLYTDSFAGLPPCRIIVAECDRLRSHADALYQKLLTDGVDIENPHVCKGQVHAFLNLRGVLNEGEDPAQLLNKIVTENFQ